jgi:hypothetical protein
MMADSEARAPGAVKIVAVETPAQMERFIRVPFA